MYISKTLQILVSFRIHTMVRNNAQQILGGFKEMGQVDFMIPNIEILLHIDSTLLMVNMHR